MERRREYWLDIGAGADAERYAAEPAPPGVIRVALDPLITTGMIDSGRLAPLPPDIRRVGGEIRPPHSVESGKHASFLPFRSGVFTRVHCGFMLHLYLELLGLLAEESRRVLLPGGELEVLLPHFGDGDSERNLRHTEQVLRGTFGSVRRERFSGPYHSFWADLYQDRTYRLTCVRDSSE
jgi:hypothetical protein